MSLARHSPDDQNLVARNMQRIGINQCKKKNCGSSCLFTKSVPLILSRNIPEVFTLQKQNAYFCTYE